MSTVWLVSSTNHHHAVRPFHNKEDAKTYVCKQIAQGLIREYRLGNFTKWRYLVTDVNGTTTIAVEYQHDLPTLKALAAEFLTKKTPFHFDWTITEHTPPLELTAVIDGFVDTKIADNDPDARTTGHESDVDDDF